MNDVFRRCRFSWYSVLIASSLALAAVLVVSDARTNDRSPIIGQPAGLQPPAAVAPPSINAAAPVDRTGPQVTTNPDEARWENGELLAPLPRDPALRAQALDQALANARARPTTGGAQHTTGGGGGTEEAPGMRSTDDPILAITPYLPPEVRNGEKTWNLKLPDQFTPDPALLGGIDPATGKSLIQAAQDKALSAALAPSLTKTWEGIGQTNLRPPDPDVSAGPSHVIAVVNARFAIYDKCGNNLYENNIAAFVGDGTNFFFDPKVIYDIWSGRWLITCCIRNSATQQSWVLLLYSDDSDPIGFWNWHYLDFTVDGSFPTAFWADYQDVGTSPTGIHITANQFNWGAPPVFQYAKIRNLDTAEVLNGGGVCWWDFWALTNPGDLSPAFSLRACDMSMWPGEYLFVNSVSYGGSFLTVWRLLGAPCAPISLTSYNLPVILYDNPPASQQPNLTYIDCGDARLMNAVYYGGDMWTTHASRYNFGVGDPDVSVVWAYQIQPFAMTAFINGVGYFGNTSLAYPAVDVDNLKNGIVTMSFVGAGDFGGSVYTDLPNGGPFGLFFNNLAPGLTDYNDLVNAGTAGNPFRWGDYYGCDLDPFDNKTLWFYGQYAATATTWGTRVGATAPNGPGFLNVTPFPGLVSGGFVGGPFNPGDLWYLVENTGGSALNWSLSGVDFWNTASQFGGQLAPGSWTWVNVAINGAANGFGPGFYNDDYVFEACWVASEYRSTQLHIGVDGRCNGSELALIPPTPSDFFGADFSAYERGVYVTAIKDFELCAVGYSMDLAALPQTIEARLYAADGSTRGALLASSSIAAAQLDNVTHFIPFSYTLQACQDYEIVVVVPGGAAWEGWWEYLLAEEPFDVGGTIRVRDGSLDGDPSNGLLPHFELIGSSPSAMTVSDLGGPGAPPNPAPGISFEERGVFVRMLDTAQLCSFGWEADLVAGETLTARVYESAGLVRGAVIAEGTYRVSSSGSLWHDIPINAQLVEGKEYDIAITYGLGNNWQWWDENTFPMPFPADVFEVVTSEWFGDGTNYALPHYRAGWDEKTGGNPFDLKKVTDVSPAPNSTNTNFADFGAYVTSQIDQEVYSLGWMADVPAGQRITARVYAATGITRGALISEGTAYSNGPGMQWHDIPLAVEMAASTDYDISISFDAVNEWLWWYDTFGMPYTINGVIQVRDGEYFGNAAGSIGIPHMRMFACDAMLTPVADDPPLRTPMFLAIPAPNPVTSSSRLDFAMEEAGPVSIVVYDVAGRRVATLVEGQRPRGWNTIHLDSSQMASGVYFLKMQTSMKAVSRKFVVTH